MNIVTFTALSASIALAGAEDLAQWEMHDEGIVRGRRDRREIALEFTAHAYAEGGTAILDALARRRAKGSFFLTGDLLDALSQKGYRFVRIDELLGK
jgi:peptidoglycan/xylan/chitin deacetylase (PgdA/CDA1 family)